MLQSGFCHVVSVHVSVRLTSPRPVKVVLPPQSAIYLKPSCHRERRGRTYGYCGSLSAHTQLCFTRSWFAGRLKSNVVRVSLHLYSRVP